MRDIDIRQRLRADERLHCGDPGTRIIEELGLCQGLARVDIAVVNGTIHGYEIKSEQDTLARLPGQVEIYNRVLDHVTLVTSPKHADDVFVDIPHWWGLWVVAPAPAGVHLQVVREATRNPEVNPFSLAQLLWRDEALEVLVGLGRAAGIRSKSRRQMWERLATELTLEELGQVVRDRIRGRSSWRAALRPD